MSQLENNSTLGAEYYGDKYTDTSRVLNACGRIETLSSISQQITDGDHGVMRYYDEGVMFILSEFVKEGYIDTSTIKYIPRERHAYLSKSALRPGDVVLTKTGYFGRSAVVPDYMPEANICADVAKVRLKEGYSPYFFSAFLNGRYGYHQLERRGVKTTRPAVKLVELQDILVPKLSDEFDALIEDVTRRGIDARAEATALYTQAQDILTSELGSVHHDSPNTAIHSLSGVFSTGRLDAEYFMPKYDNYLAVLNSFETTSIPAEYDIYKNSGTNYSETSHDVGVVKTKQLTNRGIDTEGVESWFDNDTCKDSTFLRRGDVVFASMGVGSLGKVSMFTYEGNKRFVTDSTLRIYRAKEGARVLPEVLCLFLQSEIGQEMIYRYVVGSTGIINIYDKDIAAIPIPILDEDTQNTIASLVQHSFSLRRKSQHLINAAVKSVELAIESSEQSAINFITQEVS